MTDPQPGDPRRDDGSSDEELVARVRAGDVAAYAVLYDRHRDAAIHYARRRSGTDDEQDVAQAAFLKVLTALLAGGGPRDGFTPYLLRVVRNEAIDRSRRTHETPVEDVQMVGADDLVVREDADLHAERELLRSALAELPRTQREVLWLTEVEGLAPRDVAPRLGMSANAVSQLARRGREGLRATWLQAQVDTRGVRPECRRTVASLGGYERGRLSSARQAAGERHLDGCADCTARLARLRRLSGRMRGVLLPLVLSSPELLRSQFPPAGATGVTGAGALSVIEGARTALTGTLATLGAAAVVVVGGAVALDPTDGPSGSGHASATATVGSAGGSTTDPGATGSGTPVEAPSAAASPGGSGADARGTGTTDEAPTASTSSATADPAAGGGSRPGAGSTDPTATGASSAVPSGSPSGPEGSTAPGSEGRSGTSDGTSGPPTGDPASSSPPSDESTAVPEPRSGRGPMRPVDPVLGTLPAEEPTTAPVEDSSGDSSANVDEVPTDEPPQDPILVPPPPPAPPTRDPLQGRPVLPPASKPAPTAPPSSGAGDDAEEDRGEDEF
ncbi:hypothetical protein GCM10028787_19060 [Brachybacterium horti]